MENIDLKAIKIRVTYNSRERIVLNLPVGVVRIAIRAGFGDTILGASDSLKDLSLTRIIEMIDEGQRGEIISYQTEKEETVTVRVE